MNERERIQTKALMRKFEQGSQWRDLGSEDAVAHFVGRDLGILFFELGLLLFEEVKLAVVRLGVPVLWAVHVAALASVLHKAHLLAAFPTLVGVGLM